MRYTLEVEHFYELVVSLLLDVPVHLTQPSGGPILDLPCVRVCGSEGEGVDVFMYIFV